MRTDTSTRPAVSSQWLSMVLLSAVITIGGPGCRSTPNPTAGSSRSPDRELADRLPELEAITELEIGDEGAEANLADANSDSSEVLQIAGSEIDMNAERPLTSQRDLADANDPGDPIVSPGISAEESLVSPARVTLNQAIFASLNGHPVIGLGLENIRQAQADYLTTTLLPNPTLFTDLQLMPLTKPFTVTRQGGPPQQDAILTYPIDWFLFGKRAAAMTSANLGVRVTQAEFENMVRLRVVVTAQAFYTALESQSLLTVAEQNVENFRRLESLTQQAVDDGGRPAIEASRVRLGLVAAEQRLRTAQAGSITAIAKLRAIMGAGEIPLNLNPEGDLGAEMKSDILPVDQAFEMARSERPDIQSIQWRICQAEANVDVQQRLARPSIAPSAGYTRQYQQKAIGFPDANSWGVGLNMSVPLFDRNQGNICKASAIQRQTQFELASSLLDLRSELEQAVAELDAAEQNAKAVASEQLALAQKVRDSIERSYETGGRPLTDVIDAQRNYRETYALFVTTRAEYWRALYRYYGAIGKQVRADE